MRLALVILQCCMSFAILSETLFSFHGEQHRNRCWWISETPRSTLTNSTAFGSTRAAISFASSHRCFLPSSSWSFQSNPNSILLRVGWAVVKLALVMNDRHACAGSEFSGWKQTRPTSGIGSQWVEPESEPATTTGPLLAKESTSGLSDRQPDCHPHELSADHSALVEVHIEDESVMQRRNKQINKKKTDRQTERQSDR